MDRLNELLDRKDLDLKQKTAEANDWARRYNELNAQLEETKKQLAAKGEDATLVQTAQDLLHEGKLEEARAIFDRLIQSDEANVDRAAQDHFGRASVFALQFRLDEALPDYAKAYQYRPDDQRYAEAYAYALQKQKDYSKAEFVLDAAEATASSAGTEPGRLPARPGSDAQQPGQSLRGHAPLFRRRGRLQGGRRASSASCGADPPSTGPIWHGRSTTWAISTTTRTASPTPRPPTRRPPTSSASWRRRTRPPTGPTWQRRSTTWAFSTPTRTASPRPRPPTRRPPTSGASWRRRTRPPTGPTSAATLNNLGNLYADTHRFADAEAAFKEAADIRRELAAQNPAYRPDLAATLNNLGVLYADMHRFADAEAAYKEAADIRRELARRTRPPTGPTWQQRSTTWAFSTATRTASPTAEAALKEAANLERELARRTRPPTGRTWQRRSTT